MAASGPVCPFVILSRAGAAGAGRNVRTVRRTRPRSKKYARGSADVFPPGIVRSWRVAHPYFFAGAAVGISTTVGVPMVISPSLARLLRISDSGMSRPK